MNANETTALVIEHKVTKGNEQHYEKWLTEILAATAKSRGYISREVFPPNGTGKPYVIIVRFETPDDLQEWLDSPERAAFIERMKDVLEDGDRTSVKAGIDVWFTPDNSPTKPPAYKQFLITAGVVYPLSLIVPRLLKPLFEAIPIFKNPFLGGLIVTLIMIGLITYVVMPRLTFWLHDWLFKTARDNRTREKI